MRGVLETIDKVAAHDVSVLVLGESGTGKDFVTEAIHAWSSRRGEALVRIDCAAIPSELFESELFGYERGAFTDAQARKSGRLELAGRGTVYFDEIAALTPALQAKLLRAVQDRSFTRLGGSAPVTMEARFISSSSVDLEHSSEFRRDLYYRINVVTLRLPPLRERVEDIPALAKALLGGRKKGFEPATMSILTAHSWPGNIRELRNVIDRAVLIETGESLSPRSLPPLDDDVVASASRQQWTLEELEANYIRRVLQDTRSNYSNAARILGINRKTLLEKRRKLGIE